jgi:VWFA-related protein
VNPVSRFAATAIPADAIFCVGPTKDLNIIGKSIVNNRSFDMTTLQHRGNRLRLGTALLPGGRTIRVTAIEQIGTAFNQIGLELRSQYLLGYSPSNSQWDGSFRRIQVKVRGHNFSVRTRTGYYPHRDERTQTQIPVH